MIQSKGFRVIANIEAVKFRQDNWHLFGSLGFYLQHARDTLLLAIPNHLKLEDVFKTTEIQSDLVYRKKEWEANRKPKTVHFLLDQCLRRRQNLQCMEIYARNNNLTGNWLHIGEELTSERLQVTAVWVLKEELPAEFVV